MNMSKELINGQYVLHLDPESDNEAKYLRSFARPDEPITAEIRFNNALHLPRLIIRKERP